MSAKPEPEADSALKEALLQSVLEHVPFTGFSDESLLVAAKSAGVSAAEARAAFPHGGPSLIEAFSEWADARMAERMQSELPQRLREKIALAVRARIEAMAPHKEAARRAAASLALPQHAPLAAKLMFTTVDKMWRAAGDRSSDFNYYSKRGILAGVYGATLLHWLSDSSEGARDTWTFLDARIGDVMRFEKFKAGARDAFAKFPDPFSLLRPLRPRR